MNVNSSFLDKISRVGQGKAYYFAPYETNYTKKLIRAFSNINGTISSKVKLTTNNKVLDRYIYFDTLFNYEYWTAILKIESLTEDIVITIDDKPIIIKKEKVKTTDLELNKVFATCKIEYYESLINRNSTEIKGYQDLIVKIAIENQIDSKYTAFLAINERNDKVYDVPQIEEIPIEFSIVEDREFNSPKPVFNRFELAYNKFEYQPRVSIKKPYRTLKVILKELIGAIQSNNVKQTIILTIEINIKIRKLGSNKSISNEIKELLSEIKSINEWTYNAVFNGVDESIKALFI